MVSVAHLKVTPAQLVQWQFSKEIISAVLDEDTGELIEYRSIMKNPKYRPLYSNSYAKEIGRLAQGIPGLVEGTNTMFFIDKIDVPADRWRGVTYRIVVVYYRPEKTNPYQTILIVGGDTLKHQGDCGTPTVDWPR